MLCFLCKSKFVGIEYLIAHLKEVHNLNQHSTFRCYEESCLQTFNLQKSYTRHILRAHCHGKNQPTKKHCQEVSSQLQLDIPQNSSNQFAKEDPLPKEHFEEQSYSYMKDFEREIAKFVLYLHNNNNFTRKDVVEVQKKVKLFVLGPLLQIFRKIIENKLKDQVEIYNVFSDIITNCAESFTHCETDYLMDQWLQRDYLQEFYRTSKRGRIYNKISNMKASSKSLKTVANNAHFVPPENKINFVPEDDSEIIKKSLKYDKLSSEEFDHCWKACSQLRLRDIQIAMTTDEILQKWPEYKLPSGYRLIDFDFNIRFNKCSTSIMDKWSSIKELLHTFLVKNIANKQIKMELQKFEDDNLNEDKKAELLLWALHGFLVPWQRTITKESTGKKNIRRYTVADSQNSFILKAKTPEQLQDELRFKIDQQRNIQPFILVVGESDIFVYFDGIKFPFKSFIRAVDVCFKIFHLFNLQYPKPSSTFWNFIQLYFYEISSNEKFAKVNILLNELQNASGK